VHLLINVKAGGDVDNLIELQDRDCLWPRRALRFDELFGIEGLADKNVQDFAGTRSAFANELRIVNIELSFAVAPVTVVLEQGGGELREGVVRHEPQEENRQSSHH